MSIVGGCLCGDTRYEIAGSRVNAVNCYCSMCRKAHGTAFSTHAVVNLSRLTWLCGETNLIRYESSPGGFREYCKHCGSHLLVHGQSGDGALAIPAGTLDGNPNVTIVSHIFTRECVSWHVIDDDIPKHEGWPEGYGPANEAGHLKKTIKGDDDD